MSRTERIHKFYDDLGGRKAVEARIGVHKSYLTNWAVNGIAARRFFQFEEMAREAGVPCPRDLFTFDMPEAAE